VGIKLNLYSTYKTHLKKRTSIWWVRVEMRDLFSHFIATSHQPLPTNILIPNTKNFKLLREGRT